MSETNQEYDSKILETLNKISNKEHQKDCYMLLDFLKNLTGESPRVWNGNMIGFGQYDYRYDSGREGSWFLTGFAARKKNVVLYIVGDITDKTIKMKSYGDYKEGSSCVYLPPLRDVDLEELGILIKESITHLKDKYVT